MQLDTALSLLILSVTDHSLRHLHCSQVASLLCRCYSDVVFDHCDQHIITMPYCQAWGCQNKPDHKAGKSFFGFPKPETEPLRLQRWLHNCATSHTLASFKWNQNKKVCSDHFYQNCFKEDTVITALCISGTLMVENVAGT